MNRATSVDDIVGGLWKMGRTDSEAAFQDFLTRVPSSQHLNIINGVPQSPAMYGDVSPHDAAAAQYFQTSAPSPSGMIPRVASMDLLRRLVMNQHTMNNTGMPAPAPHAQLPVSPIAAPPMGIVDGGLVAPQQPVTRVGQAVGVDPKMSKPSSDASPELSGEDGEENMKQKTLSDIRRARRMLSNRESARRSRRRKQEHLSTLEQQISGLEEDKGELTEKLLAMEKKMEAYQKENEELRAEVRRLAMERGGGLKGESLKVDLKMERTPSMQRVASLEHMTKKTRNGSASDLVATATGTACREPPASPSRRH